MKILLFVFLLLAAVGPFEKSQAQTQITVTGINRLNMARESETIELNATALASLAEKDLMKLHVFDSAGKEVLAQAVDTDYDEYHKPDLLIFQANFAPNETKTFTISGGKKREYKKEDFRAYGRFARERFDDFAWENDRVAHRTYGKALRTWKGEPLTSSPVAAQKREASKEVRSQLFKQVMADYAELRDCVAGEEGGARAAEEGTTVEEVDLNRDGVVEYEVQLSSPCVCGMVNCEIYIYRQHAGRYELLLEGAAGLGVELLKTSSNGYVDLLIEARDTAATRSETIYKFDGKQYRETGATIVHQETGERKPASRRVQFKRGASSATVQGKVSIALPDTYLIGARAGQVMTVQLTAPRKSVRFLLMSRSKRNLIADNARSWTGTLPETGDYQIIVDGDERGGTYSMTITIK